MFCDIYLNDFYEIIENPDTKNISLTKYNTKEILNFKGGKVKIAYNNKDILSFIDKSKKHSNNNKLYFGKIDNLISNRIINNTNKNVNGYNISLKSDSIRHILKKHGNTLEFLRGQIPINDNDFTLIEEIITTFDSIKLSKTKNKNVYALTFIKKITSTYNLVTYISNKNKNLEIQTLYKTQK